MTKQTIKAQHTDISARSEHWEAGHYIDASKARARKSAKRDAARARRRGGRIECREAL